MSSSPGTASSRASVNRTVRPLQLRTIAGPITLDLQADIEKSSIIGRDASADLRVDHPTVSRQHSRVSVLGGQWTITDLGSHNGTILCGQRLAPDRPMPLQTGDDVRIGACTFRVMGSGQSHGMSTLALTGTAGDKISKRGEDDLMPAGQAQMRRLADAAVSLGACATLAEIAGKAVEELLAGSRFENAVFIEATPDLTLAEAMVSRSRAGERKGPLQLSRSLLLAALQLTEGRQIGSLADRPEAQWGQSIQDLDIASAVAAPVIADGRTVGVLYGDVRGGAVKRAGDMDAWFIMGLAQVCALAASRVQNAEIRRRMDGVEKELKAARRAQRAILPPAQGTVGRVKYTSLFVPGQHVAGDFFDVVPMPDGRVACLLGDVCGHGMAAGLFMASLLTHLRDRLIRGESLSGAVDSANKLMAALNESHEPSGTLIFATLFAAAVDAKAGRLECVDCGHGYAAMVRKESGAVLIQAAEAMPLGVNPEQATTVADLAMGPDDGLIVCSDGVVEQPGGSEGSQFGVARVLACLGGAGEMGQRAVALKAALDAHAGVEKAAAFQDDVTVLSVTVDPA